MKFFLGALALAFSAYVVANTGSYAPQTATGSARVSAGCPATMSLGAEGGQVKLLQRDLQRKGHSIAVDGAYGDDTKDAVARFQRENKLATTGTADTDTWRALGRC